MLVLLCTVVYVSAGDSQGECSPGVGKYVGE